jgi:uncharacterized membrane protein
VELLSTERLIFFTDAVVAIAITLLALALPVPSGPSNAALLQSARGFRDQYLAFLISFIVIAAHWRGHHQIFRYVRSVGPIVRWNTLWLLFIVVTPFATRVLNGGGGGFQVRFILYAGVQIMAGLSFLVILWNIRHADLLRPGTPPGLVRISATRLVGLCLTFLLSIPLAFVTPLAYYFWFAVPVVIAALRGLSGRFSSAS